MPAAIGTLASLVVLQAASANAASTYDLLVIGGGSAGLTAAKFATTFGKSVAIIEKAKLGGDCTWTGCVPSKTLISCANAAHAARSAGRFGVSTGEVRVDYGKVMERVRATIDKIYDEDDSPEALAKLGIDTVVGQARFLAPKTLFIQRPDGTSTTLTAKDGVVIATGASPVVPNIDGLERPGGGGVPYITYEEIFSLPELPRALTVIGGGPIGCELGQAYARLGSTVTIVAPRLLPMLDPEAGEAMRQVLQAEGVTIETGRAVTVETGAGGRGHALTLSTGKVVEGDTLLVAVGRRPVTSGMDLDKIGVKLGAHGGIQVDAQLRTGVKGVCAAGDCTGDQQFTHYAGFQGSIAARNLLLPLTSVGTSLSVPGCTFTSPEVAHIGMTRAAAVEAFGQDKVLVVTRELKVVDRAKCAGQDGPGFIQVVTKAASGEILGATIMAPPAGELISEIAVAMHTKLKLPDLALVMHAYPTYSLPLQVMAASLYYKRLKKSAPLLAVLKKLGL